jgi:phosphoribosylformimino-5-aminoimidazole carboxamide ribotide isomerase
MDDVAAIVFIEIARDGKHSGPNLDSTWRLCESISRPVIAAGGGHDLDDVCRIKALSLSGYSRALSSGRAIIYEVTLDLA